MNMKKAMLTIPLNAALLFPAAHIASAHEGHMHGGRRRRLRHKRCQIKPQIFEQH